MSPPAIAQHHFPTTSPPHITPASPSITPAMSSQLHFLNQAMTPQYQAHVTPQNFLPSVTAVSPPKSSQSHSLMLNPRATPTSAHCHLTSTSPKMSLQPHPNVTLASVPDISPAMSPQPWCLPAASLLDVKCSSKNPHGQRVVQSPGGTEPQPPHPQRYSCMSPSVTPTLCPNVTPVSLQQCHLLAALPT